jgi:hypothetical protein
MTLQVKDTTWKTVTPSVKDAGSWKAFVAAYVKDAGTWKQFYSAGAPPPSYQYTIAAANLSGSGTNIDGSFSVTPTGDSTNPQWTMNYVSSSPPGFWLGNTGSTSGWAPTLRSSSQTASAGTLVTLTYRVNFTSNAGAAEETNVSFLHQF